MNHQTDFFFCIGVQKAGTTWLYNNLCAHPEISMALLKEMHFFDDLEEGHNLTKRRLKSRTLRKRLWTFSQLGSFRPGNIWKYIWFYRYVFLKRSDRTVGRYKQLLLKLRHKDTKVIGDNTPQYSVLSERTIQLIKNHFPELKVVLILRNPVERDWSQMRMMLSLDKLQEDEVDKFIQKENRRSDYLSMLEHWSQCFGRNRMKICFFEDLKNDPLALLNDICGFLDVSRLTAIPHRDPANASPPMEIPDEIEKRLYLKHQDLINQLSTLFENQEPNHAAAWKARMDEVLSSTN